MTTIPAPGGADAFRRARRSFLRWLAYGHFVRLSRLLPVTAAPSQRLLDTALQAITAARAIDLAHVKQRLDKTADAQPSQPPLRWLAGRLRGEQLHAFEAHPATWPGQHYKLLSALVQVLAPATVVELGTAQGLSTLTMKDALPPQGKIFTFDIRGWRDYPNSLLREEDFADGRLQQRVDDLSTAVGWRQNADLLRRADFVLVDTAHDGAQERNFVRGFDEVGLASGPIVMFDDIHLWRMQEFWRQIRRPKLDLTSFGHWSGTGLVDFAPTSQ